MYLCCAVLCFALIQYFKSHMIHHSPVHLLLAPTPAFGGGGESGDVRVVGVLTDTRAVENERDRPSEENEHCRYPACEGWERAHAHMRGTHTTPQRSERNGAAPCASVHSERFAVCRLWPLRAQT